MECLADFPAWKIALEEPPELCQDLRQEGSLLCASLCAGCANSIQAGDWTTVKALGRELEEVAWEGLHSSPAWRDVTVTTRRVYAYSQFILAAVQAVKFQQEEDTDTNTSTQKRSSVVSTRLKECIRRIDMALLMGPPSIKGVANGLIEWAEQRLRPCKPEAAQFSTSRRRELRVKRPRPVEGLVGGLPRLACPSLHAFLEKHMVPQVPVILTQCMEHWPALRRWKDMDYLKEVAGERVVPVEVGSGTYMAGEGEGLEEDGAWGQELMPLGDFIDRYMTGAESGPESREGDASSGGPGGQTWADGGEVEAAGRKTGRRAYLAQHELFEQIPALQKDVWVPDYCALEVEGGEEALEEDGLVVTNAWFGPGGTVSPTHTDPYHNLLAQVVGSKAVRLFAPSESAFLYPCQGLLRNNSRVDPLRPDLARFPLFARARSQTCVLEEGEMLYIPPLWWHHIQALSPSFSVSFWWGRRREGADPAPG
ncbi:hypothetical protein NSK_007879 [Nannochloropsis salina CCMP1776]|uniref:JmjC domain-containing protein n=1 Tax=Nannochloropsis salina CCMP1776 TaxID=1027361 RepID=A0A4D9CNG3_9STRA|nr:hypothetical protein NSK_007879 [Nannochloropsis salina CCMP1776]|eukprot:TFJ80702.1 hypothetical protein NSK_007879 [Nannochloropsis salina CCMP1776]